MPKQFVNNFLYEKETYIIRGVCYEIYKKYRNAYKESIYHNILHEEFLKIGFSVLKNKQIPVYYNNKKVGVYIPDLIVDEKILIELKSKPFLIKNDIQQFWQYLKGSSYKVGLLINFGAPNGVQIIRRVYDEVRKIQPK